MFNVRLENISQIQEGRAKERHNYSLEKNCGVWLDIILILLAYDGESLQKSQDYRADAFLPGTRLNSRIIRHTAVYIRIRSVIERPPRALAPDAQLTRHRRS